MYSVNGSLHWQRDQHVSLELFADHTSDAEAFTCEFSGALRSTVHDIPSLSATLKHKHNATKTDSSVRMTVRGCRLLAGVNAARVVWVWPAELVNMVFVIYLELSG